MREGEERWLSEGCADTICISGPGWICIPGIAGPLRTYTLLANSSSMRGFPTQAEATTENVSCCMLAALANSIIIGCSKPTSEMLHAGTGFQWMRAVVGIHKHLRASSSPPCTR